MDLDLTSSQATLANSVPISEGSAARFVIGASSQELTKTIPIQNATIESIPDPDMGEEQTFKARIASYQQELEDDFRRFEQSLTRRDKDHELDSMDWSDLEARYDHEMSLQNTAEQDVMNDFSVRFKQFMLWMQVSNEKEAERALKRFRTRTAFVQNSEDELSNKQEQFAKVLSAFHAAMALLGDL